MEHHANLLPWQELAARTGATLRYIPIADDGTLRMDEAAESRQRRTRILAFTHVSNVLGVINPVAELVALARAVGALVVLDACQSAPHLALDVKALGRRLRRVLRATRCSGRPGSACCTAAANC